MGDAEIRRQVDVLGLEIQKQVEVREKETWQQVVERAKNIREQNGAFKAHWVQDKVLIMA